MKEIDLENKFLKNENKDLKKKLKKIIDQKYILEKINLNINFQSIFSSILNYNILPPVGMIANAVLSFIRPIEGIRIDTEGKKDICERVNYTLDILHYLYMFANPLLFYDQPNKNEFQIQQISIHKKEFDILDLVLSKYSSRNPETSIGIKDYIANELNKPLPPIPIMEWTNHLPPTVRCSYMNFFRDLFELVKIHYHNLGFNIDETFLFRRIVHTSHPRPILNEVFDIISTHTYEGSEKLIDGSNDTRARFLSMFSTTSNANEGLIEWKDYNRKTGAISLQSFKLIFKVMYEYDKEYSYTYEKSSITSFFGYRRKGDLVRLSTDQVRDRDGKISKSNKLLEQKLRDLLKKHYPNKN